MPSYKLKSGIKDATDCKPAVAIIAAETGVTLSLKEVVMVSSANAGVTIEDSSGNNLLPVIYLAASVPKVFSFAPGEVPVTASRGISVLSTVDNALSAVVTAWVLE